MRVKLCRWGGGAVWSPILLEELLVGEPEGEALLADGHGLEDAAEAELLEAKGRLEEARRLGAVGLDAADVLRLGDREGRHEGSQLALEPVTRRSENKHGKFQYEK